MDADSKGFTIGQRIPEKIEETPGPGLYENDKTKAVKPSSRAVNFSATKNSRSSYTTSTMVGPGYYESPRKMGTGYSASIRSKLSGPSRDAVPGPGAYDDVRMSTIKHSSASQKMSTSPRKTAGSGAYREPGPGYYDLSGYKRFGSSAKGGRIDPASPKKAQVKSLAAPGAYNIYHNEKSPTKVQQWAVSHEERRYSRGHFDSGYSPAKKQASPKKRPQTTGSNG